MPPEQPAAGAAAISYATDRGPGGRLFWRHRNLLGNDEDFEIALAGYGAYVINAGQFLWKLRMARLEGALAPRAVTA